MSTIVLFRGKAGTGKSTLSMELAKRMNVVVLHKDDIYDSVAEYVSDHGARNKICFEFLYKFLQHVLASNSAVMLDFGLNNADDVMKLRSWIVERNGELKVIHCMCSDDSMWSERLSQRSGNPRPNQLITDLTQLKAHYKAIHNEFIENELVIDTVRDIEFSIERILSFLNGETAS
ncbi:AAA family ATPase [Paenibacillus aurantiacus]|uniref:AAA family ATPase n=1 Tax=Paenibacillus aurantiacus TaxID=1936118 RepID=A0ABV5KH49_9BACL